MNRRIARELALKTLFQMEFSDITKEEAFVAAKAEIEEKVQKKSELYALSLLEGALAQKEDINSLIESYTHDWEIKRIAFIDINILRIAIFEMYFSDEKIVPNIAINEALEIAKIYGGDETPKFINGILGKMVKVKKPS